MDSVRRGVSSTKGVFEKLERDRDDEQKGWNEEASDALR